MLKLDRYEHLIILNKDSEGLLTLLKNPKFHAHIKHINIKIHCVREVISFDDVSVYWIKGEDNMTDVFMEPLDWTLFNKNINRLSLIGKKVYAHGTADGVCW